MRCRAADVAGVGIDCDMIERAAVEDRAVRHAHLFVDLIERFAIRVKRIRVLHHELAASHETETRTDFVAELGLDLIQIHRQRAVRIDRVAHRVGDDFLGRRRVAELAAVAVFDPQQLLAVDAPAFRFDPQFGRLNRGHRQLDRAGAPHLLAHDGFEFLHGAQAERQVGVDAGRDFADHAGAHHQLLADDVGVRGNFPQRVDEILAPAHGAGIVAELCFTFRRWPES